MPRRELHLVPEPNHNQTPTEVYYLCRGGDNRRVSFPKKKYGGVSSSNFLILDSHLCHPQGQELLKLLPSPKDSFSADRCSRAVICIFSRHQTVGRCLHINWVKKPLTALWSLRIVQHRPGSLKNLHRWRNILQSTFARREPRPL